jgi:hypothetical protein
VLAQQITMISIALSTLQTLSHVKSVFTFFSTKTSTTVLAISLTLFLSLTTQAEDSMLTKKPYFTYRIEASGTLFESKINSVLLEDNLNGSKVTTELPINAFMRTDKNRIGLQVYPYSDGDFGEGKITISLFVNQDEAPEANKKLIGQITFNAAEFAKSKQADESIKTSMPAVRLNSKNDFLASDTGDVIVHAPQIEQSKVDDSAYHIYQDIELNTPFPLWGFLTADKLDFPDSFNEYAENHEHYKKFIINDLYQEHEKVYQAFKSQDLKKILPLFAERNREMDIAEYLPAGSYEKKLTDALEDDFDNDDSVLELYEKKHASPYVSDEKKLIRLGMPEMICFTDKENSIYDKYPIWFYKKDGKWIISR